MCLSKVLCVCARMLVCKILSSSCTELFVPLAMNGPRCHSLPPIHSDLENSLNNINSKPTSYVSTLTGTELQQIVRNEKFKSPHLTCFPLSSCNTELYRHEVDHWPTIQRLNLQLY